MDTDSTGLGACVNGKKLKQHKISVDFHSFSNERKGFGSFTNFQKMKNVGLSP